MNIISEALAHAGKEAIEEITEIADPALDEVIRSNSLKFSLIAGLVLLLLTAVSILIKQKSESLKYILFSLMAVVILSITVYLVGSTIYLNNISATGGPIHYHADFEIWNCGRQVDLKNPEGLSNKIGTETVHEHADNKIHIEGAVLDLRHTSLGNFFEVVGGSLDSEHLIIPTNEGRVTMESGNICPDGTSGVLQTFVLKTINGEFFQQKVINPKDYVISPQAQVPPGDCVIFEFGPIRERTDKLCNFYEIAIKKGELRIKN